MNQNSSNNSKLYAALGGRVTGAILKQRAIEARYLFNKNPRHCLYCRSPLLVSMDDLRPKTFQAAKRRKFCNHSCAQTYTNLRRERKPPKTRGISRRRIGFAYLNTMSKGELFANRKNWQAARSTIRQQASYVYELSGKPKTCFVCAYNRHTEVCHRKPVNQFAGSVMVSEINHLDNLVALCRNHHWELDHGILSLVPDAGIEPAAFGL